MSSGGILQLVAYGQENIPLNGNPEITLFKTIYRRHTNFASYTKTVYFNQQIQFGNMGTYYFEKTFADLLGRMYVIIKLPKIEIKYLPITYCKLNSMLKIHNIEFENNSENVICASEYDDIKKYMNLCIDGLIFKKNKYIDDMENIIKDCKTDEKHIIEKVLIKLGITKNMYYGDFIELYNYEKIFSLLNDLLISNMLCTSNLILNEEILFYNMIYNSTNSANICDLINKYGLNKNDSFEIYDDKKDKKKMLNEMKINIKDDLYGFANILCILDNKKGIERGFKFYLNKKHNENFSFLNKDDNFISLFMDSDNKFCSLIKKNINDFKFKINNIYNDEKYYKYLNNFELWEDFSFDDNIFLNYIPYFIIDDINKNIKNKIKCKFKKIYKLFNLKYLCSELKKVVKKILKIDCHDPHEGIYSVFRFEGISNNTNNFISEPTDYIINKFECEYEKVIKENSFECYELASIISDTLNNYRCDKKYILDYNLFCKKKDNYEMVSSIWYNIKKCCVEEFNILFEKYLFNKKYYSDNFGILLNDLLNKINLEGIDFYNSIFNFTEIIDFIYKLFNLYADKIYLCKKEKTILRLKNKFFDLNINKNADAESMLNEIFDKIDIKNDILDCVYDTILKKIKNKEIVCAYDIILDEGARKLICNKSFDNTDELFNYVNIEFIKNSDYHDVYENDFVNNNQISDYFNVIMNNKINIIDNTLNYIGNKVHIRKDKQDFYKFEYENSILDKEIKNSIKCKQPKFAWTSEIGYRIIDTIEINVNGFTMDKHTGDWMRTYYNISKKYAQERGHNIMIGDVPELFEFNRCVKDEYYLYIPLQFWFCKNSYNSLPIVAMSSCDFSMNLKLKEFNDVCCYDCNTEFIVKPILENYMIVEYFYVEQTERLKLTNNRLDYLIEKVEINRNGLLKSLNVFGNFLVVSMEFINPSKFIVCEIPFDTRKIKSVSIEMNGQAREKPKEFKFYNSVIPYRSAMTSIKDNLFVYNFALYPFKFQPSGSCNFSQLVETHLLFEFYDIEDVNLLCNNNICIYNYCYNVIRITSGLCGPVFI